MNSVFKKGDIEVSLNEVLSLISQVYGNNFDKDESSVEHFANILLDYKSDSRNKDRDFVSDFLHEINKSRVINGNNVIVIRIENKSNEMKKNVLLFNTDYKNNNELIYECDNYDVVLERIHKGNRPNTKPVIINGLRILSAKGENKEKQVLEDLDLEYRDLQNTMNYRIYPKHRIDIRFDKAIYEHFIGKSIPDGYFCNLSIKKLYPNSKTIFVLFITI